MVEDREAMEADQVVYMDVRPGSVIPPGYRLVECLGRGGYGEVWRAEAEGGFHVAVKLVPLGEDAEMLEARSLDVIRNLRHAHLIAIFGAWRAAGYLVIVMELAERTLHARLFEARAAGLEGIPGPELIEYMDDAAQALDFLNVKTGIQHRDVKPQNLLLVGGCVKLGDFGLARLLDRSVTGHTGSMTPSFAAPEFFRMETSTRSDQYSLAVTYCYLRGGRRPFAGDLAAVMAGHLSGEPDLSMLPEGERAAVSRALRKQPNDRWPTCRDLVRALARSCASLSEPLATVCGETSEHPEWSQAAPSPQPSLDFEAHDGGADGKAEPTYAAWLEASRSEIPQGLRAIEAEDRSGHRDRSGLWYGDPSVVPRRLEVESAAFPITGPAAATENPGDNRSKVVATDVESKPAFQPDFATDRGPRPETNVDPEPASQPDFATDRGPRPVMARAALRAVARPVISHPPLPFQRADQPVAARSPGRLNKRTVFIGAAGLASVAVAGAMGWSLTRAKPMEMTRTPGVTRIDAENAKGSTRTEHAPSSRPPEADRRPAPRDTSGPTHHPAVIGLNRMEWRGPAPASGPTPGPSGPAPVVGQTTAPRQEPRRPTENARARPEVARTHSNRADTLRSAGRLDDATGDYRTAIRLAPDFAAAHRGLALALRGQKKLDEALVE